MSRPSNLRSVLLLACAVVICITGARPIGMIHAYLAHSVGIHVLMSYGLCMGPCHAAEEILREKYGIRTIRVAGCGVWGPEVWYSDGFDEVMMRLVIRDRGENIFHAAREE